MSPVGDTTAATIKIITSESFQLLIKKSAETITYPAQNIGNRWHLKDQPHGQHDEGNKIEVVRRTQKRPKFFGQPKQISDSRWKKYVVSKSRTADKRNGRTEERMEPHMPVRADKAPVR